MLTVEFEGDDPDELAEKVRLIGERALRTRSLVSEPVGVFKRAECHRLLSWRRLVEPPLMRFRGRARPISVFDDVAVPPDHLAEVLQRLQNLLQQHNVTWTLDANAGEGRLRFRPFFNLSDPGDRAKLEPLACRVYDIVLEAGGTISSSEGCGLLRTQFLRRQYGELVQMFREIKDAFDPLDQLNPGKVIGDDPHLMLHNLRPGFASSVSSESESGILPALGLSGSGEVPIDPALQESLAGRRQTTNPESEPAIPVEAMVIQPALRWPELSLVEMASTCQGCGTCRTLEPSSRMCPSFRASRREAASPRSQANLIRQLAAGVVDPRSWGTDEFRAKADLCIHCNLCRSECPSAVDVSSLMLEAKAAYVENHGLRTSDWVFSRIEMWARLGSQFPILANFLLTRRSSRWLLERLLGVSRHRVLPRVRRTPFTRRAARMGLTTARPQKPGPRVVYFVDVYANYYDQELAEAVVAVLQQAGVNVFVPSRSGARVWAR